MNGTIGDLAEDIRRQVKKHRELRRKVPDAPPGRPHAPG